MLKRAQALLAIKNQVTSISLSNEEDAWYRIAKQQRFDEPIHLWAGPNKSALETSRGYAIVVVTECRDEDIALDQPPNEALHIEVLTRIRNLLRRRFRLQQVLSLRLVEFYGFFDVVNPGLGCLVLGHGRSLPTGAAGHALRGSLAAALQVRHSRMTRADAIAVGDWSE